MTTPELAASPPASPSASPADRARRGSPAARPLPFRRLLPAPSVLGFVALLALLCGLSYAVGSAVGPVAPGLHPADRSRPGSSEPSGGGGPGGMPGMPGMQGMRGASAPGVPRAVPPTAITAAAALPAPVRTAGEARR
ncbi:hypothetical protein [Streptomyces sp. NPDC093097]|uniref:hypothetical protein n=1 Tax=Streptomyces sp. NPDC093097 TaxID=3366027 RepID=UPI0038040258